MLGTPAEAARIRVCASATCSARFYDRSPAGRRRWCSMALCGNEAKARRHRDRARSGGRSGRGPAERRRVTSRYRWVILATGAVGAGAFSALRMGLPSLAPALRAEFGLSLGEVGLAFAAVTGGGMLTLVPWGALTDRIGERPVMASGLAGCAAALVGAALATTYAALLVALFVAGMFGSSATGASGRAVMGWFARSERGFALGIRQMALPLGGAVASLSLPSLIDARGLDAAFVALAGLSLTAAVASVVLMRDPPPSPGRRSRERDRGPPPTRDMRIWRLGAGGALLVCAQASMLGFIVLFLHDARDVGAATAAAALGALQIVGALVRIVAGRRSDREGLRIAPMRRIAARNAALLAGRRRAGHRARRAPLSAAGRRRHLDHELERPGLHRRGRDLRPRSRRHGDEHAEHPHLGRRRAGAHRLRRPRRDDVVDHRLCRPRPRAAGGLRRAAPARGRGGRPHRSPRAPRAGDPRAAPRGGDMSTDVTEVQSGLEGVVAFATEIAEPDREGGALRYRGVDIEELVGSVPYEKVWGLLVDSSFEPGLPPAVPHPLTIRSGDPRVDVQSALATLGAGRNGFGFRQLIDISDEQARDDLARASVMALSFVAQSARGAGRPPVSQTDVDLGNTTAERFLIRWRGEADPDHAKAIDAYWISAAEHGMNASTFTARVVASTGADCAAALSSAVGALSGPLHGGAPARVLKMLDEVQELGDPERWVRDALDRGERLMGFGHRVYRAEDPRASVLRRTARELGSTRFEVAEALERAALAELQARKPDRVLATNVEFWSAVVLDQAEVPPALFTSMFTCARVAGWSAHILEQKREARLIRPSAKYVGPPPRAVAELR